MKRSLKRASIFFVFAALVFFASVVVKAIARAEINAVKIENNAEYFSGRSGMGAVEITRASLNSLHGAVTIGLTFLLWLFIILALYNGGYAVYHYFLTEEKKKNEKH